jgi:hypothetical protein
MDFGGVIVNTVIYAQIPRIVDNLLTRLATINLLRWSFLPSVSVL